MLSVIMSSPFRKGDDLSPSPLGNNVKRRSFDVAMKMSSDENDVILVAEKRNLVYH